MNANTGMAYAVAARVSAYTPYTGITYGTGFQVAESRGANITWETEDGEFYGDNILLDSAKNVIGGEIEFENAGLAMGVREKLLGEVQIGSSSAYKVTGAPAPDVGFGYVKWMSDNSSGAAVEHYEAIWLYKTKFGMPNNEARTQEKNKSWNGETIRGKIAGVFTSSGQEHPDFMEHEDFTTLAAAKSYLNTKANISTSTT